MWNFSTSNTDFLLFAAIGKVNFSLKKALSCFFRLIYPVVCCIGLCACRWSEKGKIPEGVSLQHSPPGLKRLHWTPLFSSGTLGAFTPNTFPRNSSRNFYFLELSIKSRSHRNKSLREPLTSRLLLLLLLLLLVYWQAANHFTAYTATRSPRPEVPGVGDWLQ